MIGTSIHLHVFVCLVSNHSVLLSCVRLLRQRHECVSDIAGADLQPELSANLTTLRLAENFLEKTALEAAEPGLPAQIAVIGPTQSGKSTLVNFIVGRELARVSPRAGSTVHPQGFALSAAESALSGLSDYFHDFQQVGLGDLPSDRYGYFALETVTDVGNLDLAGTVIWDTPDFDSVSAREYSGAVLRTVALADAVLLVVSRDKYADQSVWETMRLIEPLQQPTVVCLNKIDREVGPTLIGSLQERWRQARRDPVPAIVALPYVNPTDTDDAQADLLEQRPQLLTVLSRAIAANHRKQAGSIQNALVRLHWPAWTAPLRRELESLQGWNTAIDHFVDEALSIYRRDYLDHPQHYETFQRALAELLTLLEVPGVGAAMFMLRKAVTWPVRQLGRLGKSVRGQAEDGDQESVILAGIAEHLLIRANELALAKCEDHAAQRAWWTELAAAVRSRRLQGRDHFASVIAGYRQNFQPQVESTARQLLEGLKEHPSALNGLRAARFTTDAIALAAALHSGGIGVQDFVIAPAILAVTSLMAEGVLGRYMLRAEQDLKRRQALAVEGLLRESIGSALKAMPDAMSAERRFNVPAETLESVERLWSRS
jgi:GTP-binding protein EngB required for normal cell division